MPTIELQFWKLLFSKYYNLKSKLFQIWAVFFSKRLNVKEYMLLPRICAHCSFYPGKFEKLKENTRDLPHVQSWFFFKTQKYTNSKLYVTLRVFSSVLYKGRGPQGSRTAKRVRHLVYLCGYPWSNINCVCNKNCNKNCVCHLYLPANVGSQWIILLEVFFLNF